MIRVDPSYLIFVWGGGGGVGCCTMIEIARMALSYCIKKLRKIVFLNIMDGMILRTGQSAPSAEQFKAFK